jgi:long-chain fatty acid transport protein
MVGRKLASVAVAAAALGGTVTGAVAGGFAIGTQSGSGTGNAFAGGAAAADDASVAWFNPALMTLLPGKQIAAALHVLKPSFKFENQGSTLAFSCVSPPFPACPGGEGGDGGDWAFVPNAFFTMVIDPSWSFGLALNAPFGLKTEYDNGWRGQLTALKSEVKSVNINPSVAYKASSAVSIGFGLSAQMLDAELTNSAGPAGIAAVKADDIGYGYNLGLMIQASPSTRIGAHYRSKIKYDLEGDVTLSAAPAGNSDVRADLEVPASGSLSVFNTLGNWELMADLTWTGWSSLKQLQVIRTSGPLSGTTLSTLQFQWDNTWRYSVGANYRWSPQAKLRFGMAFDETPTNDQFRTARLPDQDRTWVALGVQYKPSKAGTLDIGYAHEFIKDANINNTVTGVPGALIGKFENKADIFSIQYSMSF